MTAEKAKKQLKLKKPRQKNPKKKGKKTSLGKSMQAVMSAPVIYKPTIYLEDKQIPAGIENVKPGKKVKLEVEATITRKSESAGEKKNTSEIVLEVQSIKTAKGK